MVTGNITDDPDYSYLLLNMKKELGRRECNYISRAFRRDKETNVEYVILYYSCGAFTNSVSIKSNQSAEAILRDLGTELDTRKLLGEI